MYTILANSDKIRIIKKISLLLIGNLIVIFIIIKIFNIDSRPRSSVQNLSKKAGVHLIYFEDYLFEIPYKFNCDTCCIESFYQSDTFIVKILAPSNCEESTGSIGIVLDTLHFYRGDKPDKVDTIIAFNEQTKKIDTTFIAYFSFNPGPSHCMGILTYKVIGLKEKPAYLKFNSYKLDKCKNKESFLLHDHDTINYTDKYGLKQGLWIEYFENGNLRVKDFYKNSILQRGYEFDKNGDTIKWNYGSIIFEKF